MKRFIPIFLSLCVCISVFAFSVSAEDTIVDGRTVLDYMDYVSGYDLSYAADGWAYLNFTDSFFTSVKTDTNGTNFSDNGDRVWNVSVPNSDTFSSYVVSYIPGEYINNTYLKLENIPSGSRFWMQVIGDPELDTGIQTEFLFRLRSGIVYFDADFNPILYDFGDPTVFSFDSVDGGDRFSTIVELIVRPPEGAVYCTLQSECFFAVGRTNDLDVSSFNIEFQFSLPNLKISTSYTQLIINAIIQSKKPVGSSGIVDVDDLEEYLKDSTSDGRTEADEVMNEAPNLLLSHLSGFLFMSTVIEAIYSAGWIRGILTVSFALGIFGFIANLITSVGRTVEHRGKGAGKS